MVELLRGGGRKMSFPNIDLNTYIDEGLLSLLARDSHNLTLIDSLTDISTIEHAVYNDIEKKNLVDVTDGLLFDYSFTRQTEEVLKQKFQPKADNLTAISGLNFVASSLLNTTAIYTVSSTFKSLISRDKTSIVSWLGLKTIGYKNKIGAMDLTLKSIPMEKFTFPIQIVSPFKTGDILRTINPIQRQKMVRLSESDFFTLGASSSGATYSGELYKPLYTKLWERATSVYPLGGGQTPTSKAETADKDWNLNSRIKLPNAPYNSKPYSDGQVLFESSTAGTTTLPIKRAFIEPTVIGAGGGAAGTQSEDYSSTSAGASGSGFSGNVIINSGTYQLGVGEAGYAHFGLDYNASGGTGGTSYIKQGGVDIISSPGGGGGHSWWRSGASYASIGALPIVTLPIKKTTINKQGVTGQIRVNPSLGGASVLPSTTFGKGGDTSGWGRWLQAYPGATGYIKIKVVYAFGGIYSYITI